MEVYPLAGEIITYDRLKASLVELEAPLEPKVPKPALVPVPKENVPSYIPPTFRVESWPPNSGVVLVEAAGAVGKTATSVELARDTKAPLVKAELAQVGSYSLSGLIHSTLGYGDYLDRVSKGTAGLIVDALDEAHLKAGTQNFLAFLDDVKMLGGGSVASARRPSIVLMSRVDTAEYIRLAFEESETPLARVRISFFNQNSTLAFIRSYLRQRFVETKRPEYNVPLASPKPFERLVEAKCMQVARVLGAPSDVDLAAQWSDYSDFLGYAPVVIALAESVACANPSVELGKLDSGAGIGREDGLLAAIAESVLGREQRKFTSNYFEKLKATQPADDSQELVGDGLYSASEQVIRACAYAAGVRLTAPPPADLPTSVRQSYEGAAEQFIADHPFLRGRRFASPVFADYVHAWIEGSVEARLNGVSAPVEVGCFFASFYELFQADREAPSAPERLVMALINSWYQEADLRGETPGALLHLGENVGILMLRADSADRTAEGRVVQFVLEELSGAISIEALPRNLTIVSEGLILGSPTAPLVLSEGCIIIADEIQIESSSLSYYARNELMPTVLAARGSIRADRLVSYNEGVRAMRIYCSNLPPLLRPLSAELPGVMIDVPYTMYVALRSLLTAFRRTVHSGLSVQKSHIERLLAGSVDRERVFRQLLNLDIVTLSGSWYLLQSDRLKRVGFGLADVKSGIPSDSVIGFLKSC